MNNALKHIHRLGSFISCGLTRTIRRTNSWKEMVCSSMVSSKIISIFVLRPRFRAGLFICLGLFIFVAIIIGGNNVPKFVPFFVSERISNPMGCTKNIVVPYFSVQNQSVSSPFPTFKCSNGIFFGNGGIRIASDTYGLSGSNCFSGIPF